MRVSQQRRGVAICAITFGLATAAYWFWRQRQESGKKNLESNIRLASIDIEDVTNESLSLNYLVKRVNACSLEDDWINPEDYVCHVKSFGCSHNTSDTETMRGVLAKAGFRLTENLDEAQVVVLNSCTVKNPSQDGAVNLAIQCSSKGQVVVMAGCVVQADSTIESLTSFSCVGVHHLDKIADAVFESLKGNIYRQLSTNTALPALTLPRIRKNALVEIIPLSTGCLGACTYCKTRFARGKLGSYDMDAILDRVKRAVMEGCQQIWLSSEDTGAYGIDLGTNIVELLTGIDRTLVEMESQTTHTVMCRVGMTNPPYILNHLEKITEILRGKHWFKFLHIPVQSGSNRTLKKMNREYSAEEFELCADILLARIPTITLATDMICGFPYESEEDHKKSIELIVKYRFPVVNISQFYSRPGTAAAKMKQVKSEIKKSRSQEMTRIFMSYSRNEDYLGKIVRVWVDGRSEKSDHFVGHTAEYVKALIREGVAVGKEYEVLVKRTQKWHIEGEVVA